MIWRPLLRPVRVMERMAGFMPGESPPEVSTAMRFMMKRKRSSPSDLARGGGESI